MRGDISLAAGQEGGGRRNGRAGGLGGEPIPNTE